MASPASLFQRLPLLPQRRRRIAVLAAFLGFPLQIAGYQALVAPGRIPSGPLWGAISIVLFSATIVGVAVIYGWGQGRMGDRGPLDERQRAMTDRALIVSYGVVTTAFAIGLGVIALYLSFVGPLTVDMIDLTPVIVAAALYLPVLPFAALAWIEPDAPGDDDLGSPDVG
jgi:hypothetical protein